MWQFESKRQKLHMILLFGIMAVAAFGRFYDLGKLPRGLWADEAADANDAVRAMSEHHFLVFYSADNGREGLLINMMAFSIHWFGNTVFAVRFWGALVGVATVLLLYFLADRWFNPTVAIIAAWFLATSFWHIDLSRFAVRGILVPLLLIAPILLLEVSSDLHRRRRWLIAIVGGIIYGLGFYSYIAFRITPLLLCFFAIALWRSKNGTGRTLVASATAWMISTAFVVALPIGVYFVQHPTEFIGRTGQVSVWSDPHPASELLRSVVRTALMFNIKGDGNWRRNLPNSPELLWPIGLFFLLGIWIAARHRVRVPHQTLLVWLGLLLLPAALTRESVPHALRSVGVLPAAVILAALGADWLLKRASLRWFSFAAVVGIVVASGFVDLYRYFHVWAHRPELDDAFMTANLRMSEQMRGFPPDTLVLVVVGDPSPDVALASFEHRNLDDRQVWLPEQAQIPIFITHNRPNTTYLLTSQINDNTAASVGCPEESLHKVQIRTQAGLAVVAGCQKETYFVRLQ